MTRKEGDSRLEKVEPSQIHCKTPSLHRCYRFRPEIITHTVWLNYRLNLSFREVEDLLAERDVMIDSK